MPFSFCEHNVIWRHLSQPPVSVDTPMKHMKKLAYRIELKISELLPLRFAMVVDGWTGTESHYVAMFANSNAKLTCGLDTVLLGIAPMHHKDWFPAKEHYKFLKFVLSVYIRTLENVVTLIGDNANTSRQFSRQIRPFFVGSHGHRFNLPVSDIMPG